MVQPADFLKNPAEGSTRNANHSRNGKTLRKNFTRRKTDPLWQSATKRNESYFHNAVIGRRLRTITAVLDLVVLRDVFTQRFAVA